MCSDSTKKIFSGIMAFSLAVFYIGPLQAFSLGKYSDLVENVNSSDNSNESESSEGSVLDNIAASGEVKDYGMTSESHKKNVGKIVFSKKFIEFQNENESSFTGKFVYSGFNYDEVYFMAYFPRSFHNQTIKDGAKPSSGKSIMTFTFTVNGKKIDQMAEMEYNGERFKEWTGFSAGPINIIGEESFQKVFSEKVRPLMTQYENKIKIEISYKTKVSGGTMWSPAKPMATGEFTAIIEKNKTGMLMPKPGVKLSKNLEDQIQKTIASEAKNYGEILRVVAPEPDWIVETNQFTGVPIKRSLRIAAAIHLKTGEYKVYFYYIYQKYDGSKYSNSVYYESVANEEYSIDKNDIYK